LSAYIFTQLTDVEWEYNGLLNYDRTPKQFGYPPHLINQGDVLPINAPPVSRVSPGSAGEVEILTSHFSRQEREGVTLHWHYAAIDTLGAIHTQIARGWLPVPFRKFRVESVLRLKLTFPPEPMLGTLWVTAVTARGETVAANYIKHFISNGPSPLREERGATLILRRVVNQWSDAHWSGGMDAPASSQLTDKCQGRGAGYFEWEFADDSLRHLGAARRVRLLCEASACRADVAQTDSFATPTTCQVTLNGLPVLNPTLPNHPHDSRGVLSYLGGYCGAYGYLMKAVIEDGFLERVAATATDGILRLRCTVPEAGPFVGGLTVYGESSGRYPIAPTLVIEWAQSVPQPAV
jgi:hypothetical protein